MHTHTPYSNGESSYLMIYFFLICFDSSNFRDRSLTVCNIGDTELLHNQVSLEKNPRCYH